MIHHIERDYNIPLKKQIAAGVSKGWTYIGVFGRAGSATLMFIEPTK